MIYRYGLLKTMNELIIMVSFTLSGADGSGKTTLARLLATHFSRYGSTKIHWIRGSHFLASILLRILSHFQTFQGMCNPYYKVCIPKKLKRIWIYVEFWSIVPYILLRLLLSKVYRFLVCDRGVIDFVVWIITTLSYPSFLSSLYGRFLIMLALKENIIYLYADKYVLADRADVSEKFVYRELAVYDVLLKRIAKCSIDTGRYRPREAVARVLKCLNVA